MQRQKTEQVTKEDDVGKILESRDILNGVDADVISVETETRIKKTEYIKAVFRREGSGVVVMDEKIDQRDVQSGKYVDEKTVEDALKSDFVGSDVIYNGDSLRHVDEDTIKNGREVIIHVNDYRSEEPRGEHEFYRGEVEHVVKLTVSDKWNRERKLEKCFNSDQSASSFLYYVKQIENTSAKLSHNGDYFVIESEEMGSVSKSRYISTFKRSIISGLFVGIVTSVLGFGFLVAILSTSLIIMLDILNAYAVSNKRDKFYFTENVQKTDSSINTENLGRMSVIEEFDENFTVNVSTDNVEIIPCSLDTRWTLNNMSENLPDSDAVKFFEDVGLENLDDGGNFTATVQRRNTEPENSRYLSECGEWYLYPKKDGDNI